MIPSDKKMLMKVKSDLYFHSGFWKGFVHYHVTYSLTLSILGFILMIVREGLTYKSMTGYGVFFLVLISFVSTTHILQFFAANYGGKIGRCLVKPF